MSEKHLKTIWTLHTQNVKNSGSNMQNKLNGRQV